MPHAAKGTGVPFGIPDKNVGAQEISGILPGGLSFGYFIFVRAKKSISTSGARTRFKIIVAVVTQYPILAPGFRKSMPKFSPSNKMSTLSSRMGKYV